jgi:hypothetical protein
MTRPSKFTQGAGTAESWKQHGAGLPLPLLRVFFENTCQDDLQKEEAAWVYVIPAPDRVEGSSAYPG